MRIHHLAILVICLYQVFTAEAVVRTSGTKFLLYFTQGSQSTDSVSYSNSPQVYLTTTSSSPITVNVTTPKWNDINTVNVTVTVTSQTPQVVPVPTTVRSSELGRQPKAILIESSGSISVFGLNPGQNQAGVFAVLPIESLGSSYWFSSYTKFSSSSQAYIGLVTQHDQTEIKVTLPESGQSPVATIRGIGYDHTRPIQGTLNQYEITEIRQNPNCPKCDLTGSRIESSHPIAVFTTISLTNPVAPLDQGDLLVEQLLPISSWGRSFITMAAVDNLFGNILRVMAGEPGTTVFQSNMKTFYLAKAGDFLDFHLPSGRFLMLSGTGPLQVVQCSTSSFPFMLLVTPLEHFSPSALVPTSGLNSPFGEKHTITILTSLCNTNKIYLNGTLVSQLSSWQSLQGTSYMVANIPIRNAGFHWIHSPTGSDVTFGGFVYGQGTAAAYAAPLAMEDTTVTEPLLWADQKVVDMYNQNKLAPNGVTQQMWKLVDKDVLPRHRSLVESHVASPIKCFDLCRGHSKCKYASVEPKSTGQGRFICRLLDERMTCSGGDRAPGVKTYTYRLIS